jgi:hypothetical protein
MTSPLVDDRFFIWGAYKDPRVNPNSAVPNIVTSLDAPYDIDWNANITNSPVYGPAYGGFGGKHTLHKPPVGRQQGTLLSLPDSPENAPISDPTQVFQPRVGVSVPIGTPAAAYTAPLQVFEDHDTPNPLTELNDLVNGTGRAYRSAPFLVGAGPTATIAPAGPLYRDRNDQHPGAAPVFPEAFANVYRPRGAVRAGNARPCPSTCRPPTR